MQQEWRNIEVTKRGLDVLQPGRKLIVFDTETTGLGKSAESKNARIIQFSAQKLIVNPDYTFQSIETVDTYIDPEIKIRDAITKITNISQAIIQNYGLKEDQIAPHILSFMDSADVIAGYNVNFDIMMLKFMGQRVRWLWNFCLPSIDVAEMARDMICSSEIDSYKLCDVYDYLFHEDDIEFHRSCQDVEATIRIMQYLLQKYRNSDIQESKTQFRNFTVKSAKAWVNPRGGKTHSRIRLTLTEGSGEAEHEVGKPGFIFYDRVLMRWSHQQIKAAKDIFKVCDFQDIERQILNMPCNRNFSSMSEMAKERVAYLNRIIAAEKKKEKAI